MVSSEPAAGQKEDAVEKKITRYVQRDGGWSAP